MSAQYRPYRDEESVENMETTSWTDNELGSIQIYEKTTEDLPFSINSKKRLCILISTLFLVGISGFLIGYFAPLHRCSVISFNESDLDSIEDYEPHYQSDSSIKEKLLEEIEVEHIRQILVQHQDTNRSPGSPDGRAFERFVQKSMENFGLDKVSLSEYVFKAMIPAKPSELSIINKDHQTIYSNINNETYATPDLRPFLPLSQASEKNITTDQLLYVNTGTKEDYTLLEKMNVNINETVGKIFVIRQSYYHAHDIVITAQDNGAAAILLFPDPNTYGNTSPFPKLLQLHEDAGLSYPTAWSSYGDLASSLLSTNFESKLGPDLESKGVGIPVIPVSFKTAANLLKGLSGPQAPKEWNCFDFTLYIGPGYREYNDDNREKIDLKFYNNQTEVTTSTVTGIITGLSEPDRYVVIGSRRDSLNRGALDSVSGTAVMLEIARVYGSLLKQGWRPRRTIVFNSFGAESFNLMGSSFWLDEHQRILQTRAVAYINCDLVVTGNQSVTISASPLLYQVLFNSTKQVHNPNINIEPTLKTVYDSWKANEVARDKDVSRRKQIFHNIEKIIEGFSSLEFSRPRLPKAVTEEYIETTDALGSILRDYWESATVLDRPKVRRLDLQSIYTPFLLFSGIPVVDIRYSGFLQYSKAEIFNDMLPVIGSKYDNLAAVHYIDPNLKYHLAVTQILSEILRNLSDSLYLPFNLLDYTVTLRESFEHFRDWYSKTSNSSDIDIGSLEEAIHGFTTAAVKFHHKQDTANIRDAMKVRKINDQLMLLERTWLDPSGVPSHWERKHIILNPNDGKGFPGLVDLISLYESEDRNQTSGEFLIFVEVIKAHFKTLVHTIKNAAKVIDDVYAF